VLLELRDDTIGDGDPLLLGQQLELPIQMPEPRQQEAAN